MKRHPLLIPLFSLFCAIPAAAQVGVYVGTERVDYAQGITKTLPAKHNRELITVTPLSDSTYNLTYVRDYTVRGRKFSDTEVLPVRLSASGSFVEIGAGKDLKRTGRLSATGIEITAYEGGKEKYKTILTKQ